MRNQWWKTTSADVRIIKHNVDVFRKMYEKVKRNEVETNKRVGEILYPKQESNQMAKIVKKKSKNVSVKVEKKHRGRVADPEMKKMREEGKPVITHLPPKLHARAKLLAIASNKNLAIVIRDLLAEWVSSKDAKKKIASILEEDDSSDEDEGTEEESDEDEDSEEESEEDEDEEESGDEEEEEDEDEDDD